MFWFYGLILAFSAFIFSFLGCHLARWLLNMLNVQDIPNDRSNHTIPVPRGGGIAIIFALVSFLTISGCPTPLLWGIIGLTVISFMDDRTGDVPIKQRLLIHVGAVALSLLALDGLVFQGLLPFWLDRIMAAILLIGFLNLYNFMDGIDGITGAQTAAIGLGFVFLGTSTVSIKMGLEIDGLLLIAVSAGFLLLNWHPAKLFMGDSGSIPLGFFIGSLLLSIAAAGFWEAALILPAYYLVDGGFTFLSRLLKGEKVWEAHSQHAYQKAVRLGWPHNTVVIKISLFNLVAIILAVAATREMSGLIALAVAYGGAVILRLHLANTKHIEATVLPPVTSS